MEQQTLFEKQGMDRPLASRMRPHTLEEFVGQEHLLGPGKILRQLIDQDRISSMIFWGPPGVGKTTLARIIAGRTHANFIDFSAVTSGIKEIREVMQRAEENRRFGERTILFVDEIHRFNKAQQDAFLPFVERGSIAFPLQGIRSTSANHAKLGGPPSPCTGGHPRVWRGIHIHLRRVVVGNRPFCEWRRAHGFKHPGNGGLKWGTHIRRCNRRGGHFEAMPLKEVLAL